MQDLTPTIPGGIDDFRNDRGDYVIAAQLLEDIWRRPERQHSDGLTLRGWVADKLRDGTTRGMFEQLDFAERYANRMDMPRIACEVRELRARLLHQQGETVMSAREASASLEIAALYDLKLMKIRALLTLARYISRAASLNRYVECHIATTNLVMAGCR